METIQALFEDGVPMCIRHVDREQTTTIVSVKIDVATRSPAQRKLLHVQLTDNNDPFFYYSLDVSEEDFQGLKNEQSLKPDFATFPSKLIELLRHCIACAHDTVPLYSAELVSENAQWVMHIVKTDDFKNLVPLSLALRAGNDATIKKYLAGKLSEYRTTNATLRAALEDTKSSLILRANTAETHVADLSRALESKTAELLKKTSELNADATAAISHEREKSFRVQQEISAKFEEERRSLTQKHENIVAQLMDTTRKLDEDNKDLVESKYRSDADVKDLTSQLHSSKVEIAQYKTEITSLRSENKTSSATFHEQEKTINQQKIKISALDQQILDKDELLKKMSALLDAANTQNLTMEDSLTLMKTTTRDLEDRVTNLRAEIKKGNQIIAGLQSKIKSAKSKLAHKEDTIQQLQNEIVRFEKQNATRHNDEARANSQKEMLQRELEQAKESEAALTRRLEECRQVISNNNNVIEFLQRELLKIKEGSINPLNSVNHHESGYPNSAPSSSYKFRPKYTPPTQIHTQPSQTQQTTISLPSNPSLVSPPIQTVNVNSTPSSLITPLTNTNPLSDTTLTPSTRTYSTSQNTPFSVLYNPPPSQHRTFLKQQ